MKRGWLIFSSVVLLLVGLVSAVDTQVDIETFPNHNIMVSSLAPDSVYSLIESYHGISDSNGKYSLTVASGSNSEFDLGVWVKNGNELVISKRFKLVTAGIPITIKMLPGDVSLTPTSEIKVNDTEENATVVGETEVINETANDTTAAPVDTNSKGITGLATDEAGSKSTFSNSLIYIIAGVLVVGAVLFVLVPRLKMRSNSYESAVGTPKKGLKIKKMSEKIKEVKEVNKQQNLDDYKKAIINAESKIKEAQVEIKKLKNVEKAEELKKKIEKDQEELRKLSGSD